MPTTPVGTSQFSGGSSNATNTSVSMPSGYAVGDTIVIAVVVLALRTITGSTGWSQAGVTFNNQNNASVAMFYKTAQSTSESFTFSTGSTGSAWSAQAFAARSAVTGVDVTAGATGNVMPTFTTTKPNDFVVAVFSSLGTAASQQTSFTGTPSNHTAIVNTTAAGGPLTQTSYLSTPSVIGVGSYGGGSTPNNSSGMSYTAAFLTNQNPTAPTPLTPADNATWDSATDQTVTLGYADPDNDAASKARVSYRPKGTTVPYAVIEISTSAASGSPVAITIPANTWTGDVQWYGQVADASGTWSDPSAVRTVTGIPTALAAATGGSGGTSASALDLYNQAQTERALRALSLV